MTDLILLVQLRAWNDNNGHPVSHLPERVHWRGRYAIATSGTASFNPGLRRLADYQRLGGSYEAAAHSILWPKRR
ncbi:MAG: hypothetical protein U1E93_12740 [Alphaproteobacteria bacterium]